jgi:hypothetical protein
MYLFKDCMVKIKKRKNDISNCIQAFKVHTKMI